MMATVFACVPIIIIFLKGDDFKMLESFHQPPPSPHQHCVVWPECLISGHRFCYLSWIWFFKPLFFGGSIWRVHKDKQTAVYVWRQTFASSLCSSIPLRWQQLSACHTMRPCLSVCLLFSTFGGAQVTQGPQLCTPAIFTSYAMPDASSVFCRCLSSLLLSHVFFNKSDAGGFRSTANFRTPQLCLPLELWQIILHALQASATHLPFCHPKALHFLHSTPPFFFFTPPTLFWKLGGFVFVEYISTAGEIDR